MARTEAQCFPTEIVQSDKWGWECGDRRDPPSGDSAASCGEGASRPVTLRKAINATGSVTDDRRTSARVMRQLARQGSSSSSHAPQFPDAHNYRGVLPEIGWFSSTRGAWREPSALRGKRPRGTQSIRPGQRSPIARRFPFPPASTAQVDENRPNTGRSPPLENAPSSSFPIEGCEVKDADVPLLMRSRLQKSQNHARRARQIGKPEAAIKGRCGLPRRIDNESPRAGELRDL